MRSSSGTPTPCTYARCCPTCTLRTPPAHSSTHPCGTPSEATGLRPARTHHPALASSARPRGRRYPRALPWPRPPSSVPCQPRVPRPSGGPRRARRHPRPCAPRSLACTAHSPPARPRAPRCGALGASADRRLGRPRLPATAEAPTPTWPPAATHTPGPGLSPQATQPAHRRGARTGHADALARAPPAARPAGLAPGTPTDPTVWDAQGHCRPPAGPPATPRDRHGPRTRMAPRPTRPPAATHAHGPGGDPPPAVPRGLPYAGHRDRHQGTSHEPNTARQRQ